MLVVLIINHYSVNVVGRIRDYHALLHYNFVEELVWQPVILQKIPLNQPLHNRRKPDYR